MASKQALYLFKNREQLAKDLQLDDAFIKTLEGRGVLWETDVAYLNNTKPLGDEIWVEELLRVLAFRTNGYNSLVDVLTRQEHYDSVILLTDGLHHEFEDGAMEPPASSSAALTNDAKTTDAENTTTTAPAKPKATPAKMARRLLKSWQIPFGDCLGDEEDNMEVDDTEEEEETDTPPSIPLYKPRPCPVPFTKAHYFYTETSILNRSQIATLFSGYWGNDPNVKVAVKYVNKDASTTVSTREIGLAKQLWQDKITSGATTQHVVPVLDWSKVGDAYYLVLELAWGTLTRALETNFQNIANDKTKMLGLLEDCTKGVQWLHQKNVMLNGRLTPHNVMVFQYSGELCAKIGDFGYLKLKNGESENEKYLSPEALNAIHSSGTTPFDPVPSGDIFSLGVLFHYALSEGQHPFHKGNKLRSNLRNPAFEPAKLDTTVHWRFSAAQNLISWMLHRKPDERPSITQVLQHPIFWDEEKCLKFLEDLNKSLNNQSYVAECQEIRTKIDERYLRWNPTFEWTPLVDQTMLEKTDKAYDGDSLLSLVELITDNAEHYQDQKAYAEFFLPLFPEMVLTLFCWMSRVAPYYGCLGTLQDEYFEEYKDQSGGQCWED